MKSQSKFKKMGAEIFGCSADSPRSNNTFGEKLGASFLFLTDEDWELRLKLGTPEPVSKEMKRITWVVDGDGTLRKIYYYEGRGDVTSHVDEALETVREITS